MRKTKKQLEREWDNVLFATILTIVLIPFAIFLTVDNFSEPHFKITELKCWNTTQIEINNKIFELGNRTAKVCEWVEVDTMGKIKGSEKCGDSFSQFIVKSCFETLKKYKNCDWNFSRTGDFQNWRCGDYTIETWSQIK